MNNLKWFTMVVIVLGALTLGLLFWNKTKVSITPDYLPETYTSETAGFTIHYPLGYLVEENYQYQNLGPGKEVGGVKFTIDPLIASSTNLSTDSYLSVETISPAVQCQVADFLANPRGEQKITEGEIKYLVASSTDAGAGNRYEEMVYILPLENEVCRAVRYFIHYGAIENYPVGIVNEFDKARLLREFDDIRRTLTTK